MSEVITGIRWDGKQMVLVRKATNQRVLNGELFEDFRGNACIVSGGTPPHTISSSGRVYVEYAKSRREYYPSVVGCEWRLVSDEGSYI